MRHVAYRFELDRYRREGSGRGDAQLVFRPSVLPFEIQISESLQMDGRIPTGHDSDRGG